MLYEFEVYQAHGLGGDPLIVGRGNTELEAARDAVLRASIAYWAGSKSSWAGWADHPIRIISVNCRYELFEGKGGIEAIIDLPRRKQVQVLIRHGRRLRKR